MFLRYTTRKKNGKEDIYVQDYADGLTAQRVGIVVMVVHHAKKDGAGLRPGHAFPSSRSLLRSDN